MNTNQIAFRLVELCRRNDYVAAQRELYSNDVISIEPDTAPGAVCRGLAALEVKSKEFDAAFEVHGTKVGEPIVSEPFFACTMSVDVTERKSGARFPMSEVCVFEVKEGKVVREQFFYRK